MLGTYVLIAIMVAGVAFLLAFLVGICGEIQKDSMNCHIAVVTRSPAGLSPARVVFLQSTIERTDKRVGQGAMWRGLPVTHRAIRSGEGKVIPFGKSEPATETLPLPQLRSGTREA